MSQLKKGRGYVTIEERKRLCLITPDALTDEVTRVGIELLGQLKTFKTCMQKKHSQRRPEKILAKLAKKSILNAVLKKNTCKTCMQKKHYQRSPVIFFI